MKYFVFSCLLLSCSFGSIAQINDNIDDSALVISGGGTRGSWAAGFAKALSESGKKYKIVGGTSAGALIMSSVILEQFDKLDSLFSTITNRDVYNVNPIRKNGDIRILKSFFRTLAGKASIGETKNLRKLIEEIFTLNDFRRIQELHKILFCITTNLNTSKTSLKSIQSSSYADFLDWIWASASVPVLSTPVIKEGQSWADGGLLNNVPIDGALFKGATTIDVIALFTEEPMPWETSKKVKKISGRTLEILINSTFRNNITIGKLLSEIKEGVMLNIYYMPEKDAKFLSNLYSFESEILSEGFRRGYNAFHSEKMKKKTFIMGENDTFKVYSDEQTNN